MSEASVKESGTYPKGREKRQEILDKALEIIGREGYQKSTLRQVAQEVGLTNAGVLHHFASKEDLFGQVLARRDEINWVQTEGSETMVSRVIDSMGINAKVPGLSNLYNSLLAEAASPTHAAHNFFIQRYSELSEHLRKDIAQQQPEWSDEKCVRTARLILAAADGLQAQWLLDEEVDVVGELTLLTGEFGLR